MPMETLMEGLLILQRKVRQRVRLLLPNGDEIWVVVAEIKNGKVRLGFQAPDNVEIMREELLEEHNDNGRPASKPDPQDRS